MSSTLMALRANSEANTAEKKRSEEKKKNILVLIHHHLIENGYVEAAERLQHEAGNFISKYEVADNVDFNLILGEYEVYYEMRFDKKPKLVRKFKDGEEKSVVGRPPRQPDSTSSSSSRNKPTSREKNSSPGNSSSNGTVKLPNVVGASPSGSGEDESSGLGLIGITGTRCACMCLYMDVCMYVCNFVCVCIYSCVNVCVYVCVCNYLFVHVCIHVCKL